VTRPGPFTRVLVIAGFLAAGVLAAVGGLALRAPGVVAVGVAGFLAGLVAAAVARDTPGHTLRSTVEAAALATAGTVGTLLVVSGTAVLVGAVVTIGLLAAAVLAWLLFGRQRLDPPTVRPSRVPAADVVPLAVLGEPADIGPVAGLSTAALGREWLRTTAALAARLDATARRAIVERREATLDELERRDPAGFARWMAGGPAPGSDPAEYVRGGPVAGTEAA
jgi:hypothetical protein